SPWIASAAPPPRNDGPLSRGAQPRHREERSDEAIQPCAPSPWIASAAPPPRNDGAATSHRQVLIQSGCPLLLLDAGELDVAFPFLDGLEHQRLALRRRADERIAAVGVEEFLGVLGLEHGVEPAVQLVDDRLGRG